MAETPFEGWVRGESMAVCLGAQQTRKPLGENPASPLQQSYMNCGLEAIRQVINKVFEREGKRPVSQELLLLYALRKNLTVLPAVLAGNASTVLRQMGATTAYQQQQLLDDFGIATDVWHYLQGWEDALARERMCTDVLIPEVCARKGVIVTVDAAILWRPAIVAQMGLLPGQERGRHAVVPFAYAGDRFLLHDSGGPFDCGRTVTVALLKTCLLTSGPVVVTKEAIWT